MVYSDRIDDGAPIGLKYKLIHAYGAPTYKKTDLGLGRKNDVGEFSRKVTVTGEDVSTHPVKRFGRIRLWE
jgi:hypothetical protein